MFRGGNRQEFFQRTRRNAAGSAGHIAPFDADVAGHGGERRGGPVVLLAEGRATRGPAGAERRGFQICIVPRQFYDLLPRHARDLFAPPGSLGNSVLLSQHIVLEAIEPLRIGFYKAAIVEVLGNQDIGHGDKKSGIRPRPDPDPLFRKA